MTREKNKLVYGVGVNDSIEPVYVYETIEGKQRIVWRCPFYKKWSDMLQRCYSETYQERQSTYIGCSVCEEWLVFSNFKAWMESQDWEGKHLDKDLLISGNKLYSPETCVLIDRKVNNLILQGGSIKGKFIGASYCRAKRKYIAQCNNNEGRVLNLGYYDTAEEAHEVWRKKKREIALKLAEVQTDSRVANVLMRLY